MLGKSYNRRHRNSYYNRKCDIRILTVVLCDFLVQSSLVMVSNLLVRQDQLIENGWQLVTYKDAFESLYMLYFVLTYLLQQMAVIMYYKKVFWESGNRLRDLTLFEHLKFFIWNITFLAQSQHIFLILMGGMFSYQTHQSLMLSSSHFKNLQEPMRIGIIFRYITQSLLFVPLLIVVIFNGKRIDTN